MIPSLILLTASLGVADNGPAPSPISKNDPARMEVEKQRYAGEIQIIGNTRTRDSVILKRLRIYPGGLFTVHDLRVAEESLALLRIFKPYPRITVKDTNVEYCTILVRVEEREPTHPWESNVDDFMAECTHCLAVGLWILLGPELAAPIGEPLTDALDDWRVYKAHSRCEPLWDEVEIVMYQAVAVSSDRVRTVQQSLAQAVRSYFAKEAEQ